MGEPLHVLALHAVAKLPGATSSNSSDTVTRANVPPEVAAERAARRQLVHRVLPAQTETAQHGADAR